MRPPQRPSTWSSSGDETAARVAARRARWTPPLGLHALAQLQILGGLVGVAVGGVGLRTFWYLTSWLQKLELAAPGLIGLAFIACGAGLWGGRRWAGRASVLLFVGHGAWVALRATRLMSAAAQEEGNPLWPWLYLLLLPTYAGALGFLRTPRVRAYLARGCEDRPGDGPAV